MKRKLSLFFLFLLSSAYVTAFAQQHQVLPPTSSTAPSTTSTQQSATRDATREKLRAVLEAAAAKTNITFRQSDKQPYNFVGVLKTELKNADSFEVVISVSAQDTIHFRIFPHYKDAYLNIDKAKSPEGLMRQMVRFSDSNFLFWGADGSAGFPESSIRVVLNSVARLDDYVGQMRPAIDGSPAP